MRFIAQERDWADELQRLHGTSEARARLARRLGAVVLVLTIVVVVILVL